MANVLVYHIIVSIVSSFIILTHVKNARFYGRASIDGCAESLFLIYCINFAGSESGSWYIDLKNGSGSVGSGEPTQGKADVTFTLADNHFHEMFAGKPRINCREINFPMGAASYQLGNTSSRTITEVKQR